MKISLVTATLGRIEEIRRLMESLCLQTNKNFELIIVDQNSHHILEEIINSYNSKLDIIYVRSDIKGLSKNRNIGLQYCTGEILGFPDDDCYYEPNVLKIVADQFSTTELSWLAFPVKDVHSDLIYIFSKKSEIPRNSIMKYAISFNFFIRRNPNMYFDEKLGVGEYLGSGEETDFLWENLHSSDVGIFYSGKTYIHHPHNLSVDSERAYKYGLGFGALYYKELVKRRNLSIIFQYIYYLIRNIGGLLLSRNRKFYWNSLKGKIIGFFKYESCS